MFKLSKINFTGAQKGVSIIEVLVSISLLSMVAIATTGNTIVALKANKRTMVTNILNNLAIAKIEEFAGMDATQIDDSDDATESSVTTAGTNLTFTRVTQVTVAADGSRNVSVTVTCNDPMYSSSASYSATFAVWE